MMMPVRRKKFLALLLTASMALALLAGCAKKEQTPAGTISDFESQAHISVGTSGDASGETSKAPVSGEFVVSEKKYDYNDANIMLLSVENQTNRHFTVTVHGEYRDANGEVIKKESQTYEGFPAGWSNHFIFYPKIAFDSFTYELETEEYQADALTSDQDGVPFVSYIELTYEKQMEWMRAFGVGDENGHSIEARDQFFWCTEKNSSTFSLDVAFHVLVLDEQGNIYRTDFDYFQSAGIKGEDAVSGAYIGPLNGGSENDGERRFQVPMYQQAAKGDESVPEHVQGKFMAIFAFTEVVDHKVMAERFWGTT